LVHLMHPHQQWMRVPEEVLFLIPEGIPALRATLAANLETAINAVWEVPLSIGDRVLVAGFGIIGSLLARVLQGIPGIDLRVLEKNEERRSLAQKMGFNIQDPDKLTASYDFAFNTTANEKALQYCIDHLGFEGKVIELSWYGAQEIRLQLGAHFHQQRQQIISSQVSQLPPGRRSRWDYRRRKALVFELLKDPAFDQHLSQVIPMPEVPAFFQQLREHPIPKLGQCIKY